MATILLLSGPNLNLFGEREPEIYGRDTLDDSSATPARSRRRTATTLEHVQSNHEGELVDAIQGARDRCAAIVINPGAFTHYSYAHRRRARRVRRAEGRAAPLEPVRTRGVAAHLGRRSRRHRDGGRLRSRRVPPRARGRGGVAEGSRVSVALAPLPPMDVAGRAERLRARFDAGGHRRAPRDPAAERRLPHRLHRVSAAMVLVGAGRARLRHRRPVRRAGRRAARGRAASKPARDRASRRRRSAT